jgi:hypothetical protein
MIAMTDDERLRERRRRRRQQYLAQIRAERKRLYVEQYSRPAKGDFISLSYSQPQLRKARLFPTSPSEEKPKLNTNLTQQQPPQLQQPHSQPQQPHSQDSKRKEVFASIHKPKQKPNPTKKSHLAEKIDDSVIGHEADLDDSRLESPHYRQSEKSPELLQQRRSPSPQMIEKTMLRFKRTDSTPEHTTIKSKEQQTTIKVNLKSNKSPPPPKNVVMSGSLSQQQQQQPHTPHSARSGSSEASVPVPPTSETHQTQKNNQ